MFNTVTFGSGITAGNLHYSWGQASIPTTNGWAAQSDPVAPYGSSELYTTLNISWGPDQGIQVIMPHSNDPIGSGIQQFNFADGTTMSMAQALALAPPAPSFDPELPQFSFAAGMGQQTITPSQLQFNYSNISNTYVSNDISNAYSVQFGSGISASDISVGTSGSDLILTDQQSGDSLTLSGWFSQISSSQYSPPILDAKFADGTTWDATTIDMLLASESPVAGAQVNSPQYQWGWEGVPTELIASTNQTLYGYSGYDTFVYNTGDGAVGVEASGKYNIIKFGAGITASQLSISFNPGLDDPGQGSLGITVDNSGDVMTINAYEPQNYSNNLITPQNILATSPIRKFEFADGTSMTLQQLLQLGVNIYGDNANDTITGTSFVNRIYAGSGDEVLIGSGTSDTLYGGSGNDTLQAGSGHDLLIAGTASDTLIAGSGGDTLVGGAGNSNTFVLNLGDGQTTIDDTANESLGQTHFDQINLGSGISASSVIFKLQGNDLLVGYGSQGDTALLKNFNQVGITIQGPNLIFADGSLGSLSSDGQGNNFFTFYNAKGTRDATSWINADGTSGSDIFNADGSGSGVSYNADGSYNTDSYDGLGDGTTTYYNASGVVTGDYWIKADGTYGTDTFNADGSSIGAIYNPDSSHSTLINDGYGDLVTTYYNTAGIKTADNWSRSDGSSGTDTFNADGSSTGTIYNPDGSYSTLTNDSHGDVTTVNYDASGNEIGYGIGTNDGHENSLITNYSPSGVKLSDNWTKGYGAYGSDTFNADGSSTGISRNPDGSYSTYTNDSLGDVTTEFFNASGIKTGDNWTKADGTYGMDGFNADGSSSGISYNVDGSYSTYNNDGLDDSITAQYNAAGTELSDTWVRANGAYGSDTFNANGSSMGNSHNPDGSYSSYTNDGHGDLFTTYYDTTGTKTADSWNHSDGSRGTDTFNPDGSGTGVINYVDGSYSTLIFDGQGDVSTINYDASGNEIGYGIGTNDGQGNSFTTNYDPSGNKLGDVWTEANGSYGSDSFNADGSSSGLSYSSDGTHTTYTNNGLGNVTTDSFTASGVLTSDTWIKADGTHGSDTYFADGNVAASTTYQVDGSYSIYSNDDLGDTTTTYFDASGDKLSDTWTKANGSQGTDTFNADGSRTGNTINPDGTTSNYTNNGQGNITTFYQVPVPNEPGYFYETGYSIGTYDGLGNTFTTNYDANGTRLGDTWTRADGTHGSDTFNTDGSNGGSNYNADGSYSTYTNDGMGDVTTTDYNAGGKVIGDSWTKANGAYGNDTFNANGSSTGSSYNADGSYSSYINNGQGSITTTAYDVSGNETGYDIVANDGQGDTSTTSYNASGTKLNDVWIKTDGSTGGDTFNTDGSSTGYANYADGSSSSYANDGQGGSTTTYFNASGIPTGGSWTTADGRSGSNVYDANGKIISDSWTRPDGSHGTDTFNADGSSSGMSVNADGRYNTYTKDGNGNSTYAYFDASGNETAYGIGTSDALGNELTTIYNMAGTKIQDGWVKVVSSTVWSSGDDIFNPDGSSSGVAFYYPGSYRSTYINDGQGNVTTTNFDPNNLKLSDSWTKSDGTHGTDTFNSDGSISASTTYQVDGSYVSYTTDGLGDTTTTNFDASGNKLNDTWTKADGSYGNDTFNADGSSTGVVIRADGSYDDYNDNGVNYRSVTDWDASGNFLGQANTNYDAQGNSTTFFEDANYLLTSENWTKADGTHGSYVFNADGSVVTSTTYQADGSYRVSTFDGHGAENDTFYDANGIELYYGISNSTGQGSTSVTYALNGDKIADSWWILNGTSGYNFYNADGSSSGSITNANGTSSTYTNDGQGNVTTTNFDASGNKLSDSWTKADGTYGTDTFNPDGSTSGVANNADGSYSTYSNDGIGDVLTKFYNAQGIEVSDSWTKSDGTHGTDSFNTGGTGTPGTSTTSTYNADGTSNTISTTVTGTGQSAVTTVATATYDASGNVTTSMTTTTTANGDKTITGGVGDITLSAGAGNVTVIGGSGNDTLVAGNNINLLQGGTGNDTFVMSPANAWVPGYVSYNAGSPGHAGSGAMISIDGYVQNYDVIDGGTGYNVLKVADGNSEVVLDDGYSPGPNGGTYQPRFSNIQEIDCGTGNDIVDLTSTVFAYSDVTIVGGTGNDTMWSSSGNDLLIGGTGNDSMDGGWGNNIMQGGTGNDTITDSYGNNIFQGGQGDNFLSGSGSGSELYIGGIGNDTITTGVGSYDIIAFNKGNGQDVINSGSGSTETLSLGGGISYSDLSLSQSSNDLILKEGTSDQIIFKNWYSSTANQNVVTLQVVAQSMPDYAPGSADVLRNAEIETFNFQTIVNEFNAARTSNPSLSSWAVTNALLDAHLSSSNTAAVGGDLAYQYGMNGSLTGINASAAQTEIGSSQFAVAAQTLQPWGNISGGSAQLR